MEFPFKKQRANDSIESLARMNAVLAAALAGAGSKIDAI